MSIATKKYLTEKEIVAILGEIIFDEKFVPMSQDTYNEAAVVDAINQTGKAQALAMAAVNMACVGYGNKKFGIFRYNNIVQDITAILTDCGVKTNLGKDAKISERDLTPQRICRAFRNHIRRYIVDNKFETYLFRKYSNHDTNYAHLCFRGAEYLDDLKKDECDFLLLLYAKLDSEKSTNISDRIRRVFQAKGYVTRTFTA